MITHPAQHQVTQHTTGGVWARETQPPLATGQQQPHSRAGKYFMGSMYDEQMCGGIATELILVGGSTVIV